MHKRRIHDEERSDRMQGEGNYGSTIDDTNIRS